MKKALILVVEDDPLVVGVIRSVLTSEHYGMLVAKSIGQARGLLERSRPDLIILDRNLPDEDGADWCRQLRDNAQYKGLPVLFLTGRKSVADKVVGFKMGGDDYLVKPFSPQELAARIAALLRRMLPEAAARLELGGLILDLNGRAAVLDGKELKLTPKEFDLLRTFLERRDRVLTRNFLLAHVWGYDVELELKTKAVDMMLVGLRQKLGRWADRIEAVKGYGYKLRP
ncbi:MAG: response regulator transcription factor [Elusimicrobia bacterium]|nr:response regulator transcription factor [Elusimicrobiota bacterium]